MTTRVYFGFGFAPYGHTMNGDWSDINQWYSDPGDNGEVPRFATRLGRFPNPSTDIVDAGYAYTLGIVRNGGTYNANTGIWTYGIYEGPITGGRFYDPNCHWTGAKDGYTYFYDGTFSGNVGDNNGLTHVVGGTVTANIRFTGGALYFEEENRSNGSMYSLTLPANLSISVGRNAGAQTPYFITIKRGMTWNYPITFNTTTGNAPYLLLGKGSVSNQMPVFVNDISPASLNAYNISISAYNNSSNTNVVNLSTICTNSTPIVFGNTSNAGSFTFTWINIDRNFTVYLGDKTTQMDCAGSLQTFVLDNLVINVIDGYVGLPKINVGGPCVWRKTFYVPLTRTTSGSKYQLLANNTPYGYGFGYNGSIFEPTTIPILPQTIGAISE